MVVREEISNCMVWSVFVRMDDVRLTSAMRTSIVRTSCFY